WRFDSRGGCTDQPYDDVARPSGFKLRLSIKAYPVAAKAGLLWAYLGPGSPPLVPTWEPFTWDNVYTEVVFAKLPCHWLQCQENSIDPVHYEWLHVNWPLTMTGPGAMERAQRSLRALVGNPMDGRHRAPKHVRIGFDEFEYGFIYRRLLEGQSEN